MAAGHWSSTVWADHAGVVGPHVMRTSGRTSAQAPERTGRLFPAVRQTPIEVACGPMLLQSSAFAGQWGLVGDAVARSAREGCWVDVAQP
jgi:hypothetical protein